MEKKLSDCLSTLVKPNQNYPVSTSSLAIFPTACRLLSLGFQPRDFNLLESSSMFFASPFQPLPPSTFSVNLSLTFLSYIVSATILAMVMTLVCSSEPTLQISNWLFIFPSPRSMASAQSLT